MPPSKATSKIIAPRRTTNDTMEAQARIPIYPKFSRADYVYTLQQSALSVGAHQQVSGHALGDSGIQCDRLRCLGE